MSDDSHPPQKKSPHPDLVSLLKAKAPGAWTNEVVPLPKELTDAVKTWKDIEERRKLDSQQDKGEGRS